MIQTYLNHLYKYDGYFYEYIPHMLDRKKTWEFYLKDNIWTLGLEKNVPNQVFKHTEIIPYCQKENIDLSILEMLLMQNLITKGMYFQTKNKTSCQEYQDIIKIIPEQIIKDSLLEFEKMCQEIVKICKKPKLSLIK